MADRFKVKWDNDGNPEVVPREKSFSTQVAGLYADITETIENLLLTDYKDHAWQDQAAIGQEVEQNSPPAQPQSSSNERFEKLKG